MRSAIGWTLATPLSIARRDVMLDVIFGPEAVPADFAIAGGGMLGMRPSAFVSASTDLMAVPADMPPLMHGARSCWALRARGVCERSLSACRRHHQERSNIC